MSHMGARVLAIFREDKPYELRDIDDMPIRGEEARRPILSSYQVPEAIKRERRRRKQVGGKAVKEACRRHERLEEIERHLESVNQKLMKYYLAFEKGTVSDDDAAPKIREPWAEQIKLQSAKEEALVKLEDTKPKEP